MTRFFFVRKARALFELYFAETELKFQNSLKMLGSA